VSVTALKSRLGRVNLPHKTTAVSYRQTPSGLDTGLWNNSFTYSITFHTVSRTLRVKSTRQPKKLRAEPEMPQRVTYMSTLLC